MNISLDEIVDLLTSLVKTPSFSREEDQTATLIESFLQKRNIEVHRLINNVYAVNRYYRPDLPVILLNSHHDTVKPNSEWAVDPFSPEIHGGRLTGLGANDAGASLVCLLAVFLHYFDKPDLRHNLIYLASAEEEVSGSDGVERVLPELGHIDLGIVGEPTHMQMAVAEKGLIVLDCIARGRSGHAAREEGVNAIYIALKDIAWLKAYRFPERSELLGDVKMSTTVISAGTQHNVVPDRCEFTVDVRSTDKYSNEQILDTIRSALKSEVIPRSVRLQPSSIPVGHPLVRAARETGIEFFGSSTTSDQALMSFPTVKMGPGDSARSHTAGEYILLEELEEGIDIYKKLLGKLL